MKKLLSLFRQTDDPSVLLQDETSEAIQIYEEKEAGWEALLFAEMLMRRREEVETELGKLSTQVQQSDPAMARAFLRTELKSFARGTVGKMEKWIVRMNAKLGSEHEATLGDIHRLANEYHQILSRVLEHERIVRSLRSSDRKLKKALELLSGVFWKTALPLRGLPEQIIDGIQGRISHSVELRLNFETPKEVKRAHKLIRGG